MTVEWISQVNEDESTASENRYSLLVKDGDVIRFPTKEESERAIGIINECDVTAVKIFCRTETCSEKGSWIQRARDDIKKVVYTCEVCKQPMVR